MLRKRPMRPPRLTALILLPILAGPPALAAGDDPDLPAQSMAWHYITDEDSSTSSHCLGRPDSPLCATETLLACFQRNQFELCRMVDDGAEQYASAFASPAPADRYLAYRIVLSKRLAGGDMTEDESGKARAGDVLIVLDQRDGAIGRAAPSSGAPVQRFLLRRAEGGTWKVVTWGGPGD